MFGIDRDTYRNSHTEITGGAVSGSGRDTSNSAPPRTFADIRDLVTTR